MWVRGRSASKCQASDEQARARVEGAAQRHDRSESAIVEARIGSAVLNGGGRRKPSGRRLRQAEAVEDVLKLAAEHSS